MIKWIKAHKKQLFQLLMVLVIGAFISGIFFLIFYITGVIQFDNGFVFNKSLFDELKDNPMLYIVYMLVEAIGATLLCMNPVGSGVFVWLGIALFGANWKCFLATFGGCFLSYVIIYAIGRFGGSKLITKIFGEEEYNKTKELINEKGLVYVPIMYLLPLFPDDFICLCVGSMKMKWWLHMIYGGPMKNTQGVPSGRGQTAPESPPAGFHMMRCGPCSWCASEGVFIPMLECGRVSL